MTRLVTLTLATSMVSCASLSPEQRAATRKAELEAALQNVLFHGLGTQPDVTLSQFHGRVVLFDVWATWCAPCRGALKAYQVLQRLFGPRGLVVYGLSVDRDQNDVVRFLSDNIIELPILHDPGGNIADSRLNVTGFPTSFLIDRQGRLREVQQGFGGRPVSLLAAQIQALLNEGSALTDTH